MAARKPVRSQLVRHSIKMKGTATGLSPEGEAAARAAGARLPLSYKVRGAASPVSRAHSTMRLGLEAFRIAGGKAYEKIRSRKSLGLNRAILDMYGWMKFEGALGEVKTVRLWIDGKIPKSIASPAAEVADEIIKRELAFGDFLSRRGIKGILLRNQTHSGLVEAVFERLTGKKFDSIKPAALAKENEAMTLTHFPDGTTTLQYRGKIFDVTKRFNKIISEK